MRLFAIEIRRVPPDEPEGRAAPRPPEPELRPDLPWGLHPVLDLVKMVDLIAESQQGLWRAVDGTRRSVLWLALVWMLVGALNLASLALKWPS